RLCSVLQQAAQEVFVVGREGVDEAHQHRGAVGALGVQDALHAPGGQFGRVPDGGVGVAAADRLPGDLTLVVQPGQHSHHGGVGQSATECVADLGGGHRLVTGGQDGADI